MRPRISLLHLSDLHVGWGRGNRRGVDQAQVLRALRDDVLALAESRGPVDLIVVTGDIAFAGQPSQYAEAQAWLFSIAEALRVSGERVLCVPGNHDVDRTKVSNVLVSRLLHESFARTPREHIDDLMAEDAGASAGALRDKFHAYLSFAKAVSGVEADEIGAFQRTVEIRGIPLKIIGLNTAICSYSDSDSQNSLALGIRQIGWSAASGTHGLTIVLGHHPPACLADGSHLEAALQNIPHLLLTGHVHEARLSASTLGGQSGAGVTHFSSGAAHTGGHPNVDHTYQWMEIAGDGIRVFPRVWEPRRGMTFVSDGRAFSLPDGQSFLVPTPQLPRPLERVLNGLVEQPRAEVPRQASDGQPLLARISVPYGSKGSGVVGRRLALDELWQMLRDGKATVIGQTAAISGLGGVGKTQLAVEYCWQYGREYPGGVYWLDAFRDIDAQLLSMARSAAWVSQDESGTVVTALVRRRFRDLRRALIVLDGVESDVPWELMPPRSHECHVLATSRVDVLGFEPLLIDGLSIEDSVEMLQKESRRIFHDDELAAAGELSGQFEGLPLALELAGAWLRRRPSVSMRAYADLVRHYGLEAHGLRRRGFELESLTGHAANLHAALRVSESVLEEQPEVATLLDALAWSGAAPMDEELLMVISGLDRIRFAGALGTALTYQYLRRINGGRVAMHRLVQSVRRFETAPRVCDIATVSRMHAFAAWLEQRRQDFANLPLLEGATPHLITWCELAKEVGATSAALRLEWLSIYPGYLRGRYLESERVLRKVLKEMEAHSLQEPVLEARVTNDLGATEAFAARPAQAVKWYERALACWDLAGGEENSECALTHANMGVAYGRLQQRENSRRHIAKALALHERHFGRLSRQMGLALNMAGIACRLLRMYEQAITHFKESLQIRLRVLGEMHPDTAHSYSELARYHFALHEHRAALSNYSRALEVYTQSSGPRHPMAAICIDGAGSVYLAQGEFVMAQRSFELAWSIFSESLGDSYPAAVWSRVRLAEAYAKDGKLNRARSIFEELLQNLSGPLREEVAGVRPKVLGNVTLPRS